MTSNMWQDVNRIDPGTALAQVICYRNDSFLGVVLVTSKKLTECDLNQVFFSDMTSRLLLNRLVGCANTTVVCSDTPCPSHSETTKAISFLVGQNVR